MNVLVLLPRLQIAIHFVVPIPAPYKSSLHFQYVYGSFQVSNKHVVGCDIYIYITFQTLDFWQPTTSPSPKNFFFFFFGCDVVSPKFPNCSSSWFTLVSCFGFAPPLEVWPPESPWNTIFPVGKHPVEDGRWKKTHRLKRKTWTAMKRRDGYKVPDGFEPGDLGGAGGELLGCPVGSW